MELYIHHGRTKPDEELNDWGPNGPTLKDVTGIHQTYGNACNVFFTTQSAATMAKAITGWEWWDDKSLTMRWEADQLVVDEPGKPRMYYGDWGITE